MAKFESAHDWFNQFVQRLEGQSDVNGLAQALRCLALQVDSDDIQDAFQSDMEFDGYFENAKYELIVEIDRLFETSECLAKLEEALGLPAIRVDDGEDECENDEVVFRFDDEQEAERLAEKVCSLSFVMNTEVRPIKEED